MRKTLIMMMVLVGAMALILPTAVLADWAETWKGGNESDYFILVTTSAFSYGMESPIGYDTSGTGNTSVVTIDTDYVMGAPENTIPCPLSIADPTSPYTFEEAFGNCPGQFDSSDPQTDPGDIDSSTAYVILDDLYQAFDEEESGSQGVTVSSKSFSQALDIFFYDRGSVGNISSWTAPDATIWKAGTGVDQTLDQDIADSLSIDDDYGDSHKKLFKQTMYIDVRVAKTYNPTTWESEFVDQWVAQFIRDNGYDIDSWTLGYGGIEVTGEVTLFEQSYSSWFAWGNGETPADMCEIFGCTYEYNNKDHAVVKTIKADASEHFDP